MPDNTIDLITRFLADTKQFDKSVDSMGNNLTRELSKSLENAIGDFKRLEKEVRVVQAMLNVGFKSEATLNRSTKAVLEFGKARKKIVDTNQQIADSLRTEAKLLRQQAASLSSDYKQALIGQLNFASGLVGSFSTVGLALGTGLVGGIFAFATKYVNDAKVANEVTLEWKKSQDSLAKSGQRVGLTLAREALPLLRQAAKLADEASKFVETHPEIVRAALNAGLIIAGISTIGLAVSKGIKLYADALYLTTVGTQFTAAKLMDAAADKQLLAAGYAARGKGLDTASTLAGGGKGLLTKIGGAGGLAALIGQITVLLGSFAAGLIATDKVFDVIEKRDVGFQDYVTTFKQAIAIDAKKIVDLMASATSPFGLKNPISPDAGNKVFKTLAMALGLLERESDEAASSLNGLSSTLANSLHLDEVLNAYEDYKEDDKQLVRDHYRDRQKIVDESLADERASNTRFASDIRRVRTQMTNSLAKAFGDYQRAETEAEEENAIRRAEIVREGGEEVRNIEASLQEDLRKLKEDSVLREAELTANRDALGLAKQREQYNRERDERIRDATSEIAERRRDIAQRLTDLQNSFIREREKRFEEYQIRASEIRTQAAEEIKQLQETHAEEIRAIQQQRVARLKEVDAQFREERTRRYQALIAQIRDLDAALLGEDKLREQHYQATLRELDAFLAAYRSKHNSILATGISGSRQSGGYVNSGLYQLHQGEFVLNPATTRLMESMLGAQLTQANVAGATTNRRVTLNDQRRFDSRLGADDRRAIRQETEELLLQFIGG